MHSLCVTGFAVYTAQDGLQPNATSLGDVASICWYGAQYRRTLLINHIYFAFSLWPSICSGHTNEMRSCFCCDEMYSYEPGFGYGLDNCGIVVRFQAVAKVMYSLNSPHWLREAVLQKPKQPNCTGYHSLPSILYSWFRASSFYINRIQQDATDAGFYYCKITLHVSGVYRPHHQEYIKL